MNPVGHVNFTAQMLAAEACSVGHLLVYDSTAGYWKVATAANRGTKRSEAIALTAYGGSVVGTVQYQAAGIVPASVSGLSPAASASLVRCSSTGTIERVDLVDVDPDTDDIIGYAEADGRVHLHFGLPVAEIVALAGGSGGGGAPADAKYLVLETHEGLPDAIAVAPGSGIAFENSPLGMQIAASDISDANVASDANIAGTKVSPDFGSQNVETTGYVQAGHLRPSSGTPASQGIVRGPNATVLGAFRNAAGNADYIAVASNSSNDLLLGTSAAFDQQASLVRIYGANGVAMGVGSGNAMTVHTNAVAILASALQISAELAGNSSLSIPFRWKRALITKSGTADTTLTASQAECPIQAIGGTPGGDFNIIGPNTTNAFFIITNSTANNLTFKRTGGTGVTIATGKSAIVRHDGSDYIRLTPDT